LTAALLLRHSAGLEQEALDIETAVRAVLEHGYRTADLARNSTSELTDVSTALMGERVRHALHHVVERRQAAQAV